MFKHTVKAKARAGAWIAFAALGAALLAGMPGSAAAQDEKGVGLVLKADADTKDVGLPLYPGSKPEKDEKGESQSANLGLWGGGSGFKMAVVKMQSSDPAAKVAEYYKKKLAKYGKVLDCSQGGPKDASKSESSKELTCEGDAAEKGAYVFKVGTKEKQHIAAIQPNGTGSVYQLVALGAWGTDK